jgi:hypothetical protein
VPILDDLASGSPSPPIDGTGSARARCVWRWFRDDAGYAWNVALATTVAVPTDEMTEDVASVARSWRAA